MLFANKVNVFNRNGFNGRDFYFFYPLLRMASILSGGMALLFQNADCTRYFLNKDIYIKGKDLDAVFDRGILFDKNVMLA